MPSIHQVRQRKRLEWLPTATEIGAVFGYPTEYDLIANTLTINFTLGTVAVAIAISTANWVWIGLSSMNPARRVHEGWPLVSLIIVALVTLIMVGCGIGFAVAQPNINLRGAWIYLFSSVVIVLTLFSVVSGRPSLCWEYVPFFSCNLCSGAIVLATIHSIESSDPKVLVRTAVQLIVLSTLQLVCAILLVVISSLPAYIFSSFDIFYGLTTIFTAILFYLLQLSLLFGFRIAVWQLKEVDLGPSSFPSSVPFLSHDLFEQVALPRANTVASTSSNLNITGSARFHDSGLSASSPVDSDGLSTSKSSRAASPDLPTVLDSEFDGNVVVL